MNRNREADNAHATQNRRLKLLIFCLIGVLVALILALIVISANNNNSALIGTWTNSDKGQYRFNGSGKGDWIVDDDLGKFNYEINGDTLDIDFVSKRIPDRIYKFRLENDTLILIDDQGVETAFKSVK